MIIALDIATHVGIAVGEADESPRSWSVDLGSKKSHGHRFSQVLRLTQKLLTDHSPSVLVAEAAIGGPKASAYLIGLVACVEGVCVNRGVRFEGANLGSVRKHFLGKHFGVRDFPGMTKAAAKGAIKQMVVDRCNLLGWAPDDHDAADALAVWDWWCATHERGYQAKPTGGMF